MINRFFNKYRFLSNFYEYPIVFNNVYYQNAESAYQAQKTLDDDVKNLFKNIEADTAKRLGRTIKVRKDWDYVKDDIMYQVLKAKFNCPEMSKKLKDTGDEYLLEGNTWHDNYWGSCKCPKCKRKVGKNMLGILLMRVRDEIK